MLFLFQAFLFIGMMKMILSLAGMAYGIVFIFIISLVIFLAGCIIVVLGNMDDNDF